MTTFRTGRRRGLVVADSTAGSVGTELAAPPPRTMCCPPGTARTAEVSLRFGLSMETQVTGRTNSLTLPLRPGHAILVVGPSGSGKSTLLADIERARPGGCAVHRVEFPEGVALIDRIVPGDDLGRAIEVLTLCGLGEPRLWLREYRELSEGERFRARLARVVGLHLRDRVAAPLLCDEFGATLHPQLRSAAAFCLRKLSRREGLCLVAASSDEAVVRELQPDLVVHLGRCGQFRVEERTPARSAWPACLRRLSVEPGRKRDYAAFAAMHYRPADELGFVDKVFVLRSGGDEEALGVVVYAHPPLELSLRNRATNGRFSRNAALLNRSMRILRRLVIHPDLRGCGLGHFLVRRTLPLVGTEYVECLAVMGAYNPVFEKAGMNRIGQCDPPPVQEAALRQLRVEGIDPFHREFPLEVARRPGIRQIVADVVYGWYAATTGGGRERVERQSAEFLAQTFRGLIATRPVYYLWRRADGRVSRSPGDDGLAAGSHDRRIRRHLPTPERPPAKQRHASPAAAIPSRATERRRRRGSTTSDVSSGRQVRTDPRVRRVRSDAAHGADDRLDAVNRRNRPEPDATGGSASNTADEMDDA